MGGKQSTSAPRGRTFSNSSQGGAGLRVSSPGTSGGMMGPRARARSLGSVANGSQGHPLSIPAATNGSHVAGSPDSDSSTPEENAPLAARFLHHQSLPLHLFSFQGIKCPVCNKFIPPDDIECHLVMCLTKPRITYNEDVLDEDKGECVICLEEMEQGDTIARLPCLCIYHKSCIDGWFQRNRSCPEHPLD